MAELSDRLRGVLTRAAQRQERATQGPERTTRTHLVSWAQRNLSGQKLVIVSNREPYTHVRDGAGVRWIRNAGGLTVALDSVAQSLGAVWIAHGNGDADRDTSDAQGRTPAPPDAPSYTLRRLWLTDEDQRLYYSGFSNGALWPLCHIAYVRPRFEREEWERYRDVNQRFAQAVLEEIGDQPAFVFLQDYHLALAARTIREQRPDAHIATFWHIPWPNPEVFRVLPWRNEILDGLLANDLVGFHIHYHSLNFLDSVASTLEARVDHERIAIDRGGRRTWIRSFPIGVNATEIGAMADSSATREQVQKIRRQMKLGGAKVLLGVDRMDYTKGIPERIDAVERLLENHPEWVGHLAFIQVGVPSRVELDEYQYVTAKTRVGVQRLNERFPGPGGRTAWLIEGGLDFRDLVPYYRLADLLAVTSLHDGMNLVSKEYVATRSDLGGALVLSPFTGAARELERAWSASPYDRDGMAEVFHAALSEAPEAGRERMQVLRETVLRHNIFDWAIEVFDTVQRLTLRTPQSDNAGLVAGERTDSGR